MSIKRSWCLNVMPPTFLLVLLSGNNRTNFVTIEIITINLKLYLMYLKYFKE